LVVHVFSNDLSWVASSLDVLLILLRIVSMTLHMQVVVQIL